MSDVKSKILSVIGEKSLGVFATVTDEGKPWARYIMVQAADDLTVRFSTFKGSRKTAQILNNPEVHITAGVADYKTAKHYVQVQGKAEITDDAQVKKTYWSDDLKAYFQGPEDPNYLVVEVKPYRIEYQSMGAMTPEVWEA